MNGNRYVLDTNAAIALLQGNSKLLQLTHDAGWLGISIISYIEFLCFSGLTATDRALSEQFVERVEVLGLGLENREIIDAAIHIRQASRMKLPDAIIAATAIARGASLVTNYSHFNLVEILVIVSH